MACGTMTQPVSFSLIIPETTSFAPVQPRVATNSSSSFTPYERPSGRRTTELHAPWIIDHFLRSFLISLRTGTAIALRYQIVTATETGGFAIKSKKEQSHLGCQFSQYPPYNLSIRRAQPGVSPVRCTRFWIFRVVFMFCSHREGISKVLVS